MSTRPRPLARPPAVDAVDTNVNSALTGSVIVDGRSRRPIDGLVWARWTDLVQIDRKRWYRTDTFRRALA